MDVSVRPQIYMLDRKELYRVLGLRKAGISICPPCYPQTRSENISLIFQVIYFNG